MRQSLLLLSMAMMMCNTYGVLAASPRVHNVQAMAMMAPNEEPEPYPLNISKTQTATTSGRYIKSIKLNNQSFPVYSSVNVGVTKVYKDMMNKAFTVKAGDEVQPQIGFNGAWMDGYVYVDFANDGAFNVNLGDNYSLLEGNDLVSFSWLAPNNDDGVVGKNSKGEDVPKGNHVANGAITPPSFTIPAGTPIGFYRMRYKTDWNYADAGGDASSIVGNGGNIIDIRLNVHGDEVNISTLSKNGTITATDESALPATHAFGQPLTIKASPKQGYELHSVRIRHGYNLTGDSLVHGTPQYVDAVVRKEDFTAEGTYTLAADMIDGDVLIEPRFIPSGTILEEDLYPIGFSKNEERTRADRTITGVNMGSQDVPITDLTKMYYDKTSYALVAKPGQTVKTGVNYTGGWMHAYTYVDKDHSGFFDVTKPTGNGQPTPENELVSYSALTLAGDPENTMHNSAGSTLTGGARNTLDMPPFQAPTEEGFYRMRYKVDWDSELPGGNVSSSNHIVSNGGGIIDVRLRVTNQETINISSKADHGTIQVDGQDINGTQRPIGQGFTLSVMPDKGYALEKLMVRHGVLTGDSVVQYVAQRAVAEYMGNQVVGGMLNIPASLVDGDMEFTAIFKESEEDQKVYTLVFSDEFNQEDGTQPDPTKWGRSQRYGSTWNRFISNSNDVVYIQDGNLVLRAIANSNKTEADPGDMITGSVETQGKFSYTYGKLEVRMKTTPHTGNFPAAWLMPQPPTQSWPAGGEIDIFEAINSENTAYHTVHTNWTYTLGHRNDPLSHSTSSVNVADWHVYGLEWDATSLKWYVDGRLTFTYNKSTNDDALQNGQWPYDKPFYIILNQSVGDGSWAAAPDKSFTYESRVDYVRLYQLVSTGITTLPTREAKQDNQYYDLTGRRVGKPTTPGIYIVNGKKVVVK